MKQIIATIFVFLFVLGGCTPSVPQTPVWDQVKFKDLAPPRHSTQAGKNAESLLEFNVYILSVPAGNLANLKSIWTTLLTKQIRFSNGDLFGQNGFVAGFGQTATWRPIGDKLRAAESKSKKTVDLVIPDNGTDRISLLRVDAEKNIFYKAQDNQVSGVTLGPGEAMLRLTAATIPDMRGICKLTIEPTFSTAAQNDLAGRQPEETAFNSVSFTAKMSPGDFVLLGPAAYTPQDMTLSAVFFSVPDTAGVQLYLIVCSGVPN